LQLLLAVFFAPGLSCVWILSASMIADICDIDELETGLRREGIYGAVFSFVVKLSLSATMVISGYLITFSGFDRDAEVQTLQTILRLRLFFILIPLFLLGAAIIFASKYPVTCKYAKEVQEKLANLKQPSQTEEA